MSDDRQHFQINSLITLPGAELEKAAAGVLEKAGGNLVDGTSGFVGNIFNGVLGDRVREWRTRNMIEGAAKTAVVLKDMGVSLEAAKAIPTMEIYSIFTGMSEASDPEVSDLWAGLLASRMDPANNKPFDKLIVQTLGVLNGVEATVLDFLSFYERQHSALTTKLRTMQVGKIATLSEDYSQASKRLQKQFRDDIAAKYDAALEVAPKEALESSVDSLLVKGLIYHYQSTIGAPRITRTDYIGDSSHRVEVVDAKALERSLQELQRRVAKARDSRQGDLTLCLRYPEAVVVPFRLTSTGEYLLSHCKPAERSPEQPH